MRAEPSHFAELADEALYHLVRTGELGAFDALYGRYEGRLFGFLLRLVRNHHDAEDLLHETFLSVLRSREVTFDRASFCTWLYRIGRNLGLNHLRSGRRRGELGYQVEATSRPTAPECAERLVAEGERAALLSELLDGLTPSLAAVYELRRRGLSYEEMAAELQIPLGTVKSRMSQLTQRLHDQLAARLADPAEKSSTSPSPSSPQEPGAHGLRRN